ncbi:MAG TPA: hypothetical protein VMB20_00795, partial [Candidatus Acidoferrum sp.]|nr:hypothetical protein [Candidatus Acidoferrum sp.]
LRAMLSNTTGKIVTHVGVLVERVGLEYEFPIRIRPHRSTGLIIGLPYSAPPIPITRDLRGPVANSGCWARWVDFADGTSFNVSPL